MPWHSPRSAAFGLVAALAFCLLLLMGAVLHGLVWRPDPPHAGFYFRLNPPPGPNPLVLSVHGAPGPNSICQPLETRFNGRPLKGAALQAAIRHSLSRYPHPALVLRPDLCLQLGDAMAPVDLVREAWPGMPIALAPERIQTSSLPR